MSEKINLVIKKTKPHPRLNYISGSSIFFAIALLLSVGLIVMNLSLRSQLNSLTIQENQLTTQYNAQGKKRATYLVTQAQLSQIHTILTTRDALNERLNGLLGVLPANLMFNRLSADGAKIVMGISSADLAALNKVIETTLPEYAKKSSNKVKTINLTSFGTSDTSSGTGQYDALFEIQYR